MVKTDLVPDLLDAIHEQFDQHYAENQTIQRLLKKLEEKKTDYVDAYHYAKQVGEALSRTLGQQVTVDILPNGKMYYNIAERVMSDTLHHNYELVSDYAAQTQQTLNDKAGIHIKAQRAEYNVEKADGLIQTLTSKEDFEKGKWLLKAPVETFTMSVVDDTVRKNLEFHAKAGLRPRIIRRAAPDCCDWCNAIAGEYLYGQEPSEVFRRHDNCECMCVYDPRDWTNKRQDVWSKKWNSIQEDEAKIEKRTKIKSNTGYISDVRKRCLASGIDIVEMRQRNKQPEDQEIIDLVGGGDTTKGSCSSAAFAYIGNKAGYEVRDFRGGMSRSIFAQNGTIKSITEIPGVQSQSIMGYNDYKSANELFKSVETGKEYYLAIGEHAAIIRKVNETLQYLELQSNTDNGFHDFTSRTLKKRFGCRKSHTFYREKYQVESYLIDVESLYNNNEFVKLLRFINTLEPNQMKGALGNVK